MRVATLSYRSGGGWSGPFPDLDSTRTLVLVFGASDFAHDPAPLKPLFAAFPQAKVVGCSTAGEICGATVRDESLTVAVACFESTDLRIASAIIGSPADCAPAGREIACLLRQRDLSAVFLLSEGINVNGTDLLRGLNDELDPRVVVTGGLAGDGSRFHRTWTIDGRKLRRHRVVAVGFYGPRIRVGHGSYGGWETFGVERVITRSIGNVLFEVDGRPALRLYKEHLGELASGLPAAALMSPMALRRQGHEDTVVRTILSIDEATQSMTFAGDIPQGGRMQFMQSNFDRLIKGANQAARLTGLRSDDATVSLAVAISCVGRRLVLRDRAKEEVAEVTAVLPRASSLVGFYSYGEFSPQAHSGRCELHNQTMTLTHISES
jgi:hypothetical protein